MRLPTFYEQNLIPNWGNVMLRIDDKDACTLNNMWSLISNVYHKDEDKIKNYENRGNVGSQGIMKLDGVNVGTAQFCNAQKNQKCPYNSNTSETKWTTIELKLSFNNSFSYRKHTVSVKGNWRDRCDDSKYSDKIWDLKNTLHGFIYPTNLDISRIGYDVRFTWTYSGWDNNENSKGKWVLYKKENGTSVKQAEVTDPRMKVITIAGKNFRCLATYYLTFLPNGLSETATISGLTISKSKGSHTTLEGVCQFCQHGIFSYTTTDGKAITLASNIDFGSKILSHTVDNNGKCIIEFEDKFTRIPDRAFLNTKINSHNIKIPNTVTSIGSYAFNNTAISGYLAIPNSVTEIGDGAFSNCSSFYGLTLSNKLTKIGNQAFMNCNSLSGNLTIPNSVTEIGVKAFDNCGRLNGNLTLSTKLKTIGDEAFASCCKLHREELVLPATLESLGENVFQGNNLIKRLVFQSLPEGISKSIGAQKAVSLSDESYISDKASGTVNEISYTRQMSNNWGTLVLPYSLTLTGEESYRLYTIDKMDGDELVLKQLNGEVAAGTPCVVKRNGTEAELIFGANDATLNMTIDRKIVGDMTFHGTYTTEEVNSGYVISKDCFWNVDELNSSTVVKGVKVSPFRAWLDGTSANAPAKLSMRIDGSTTGIDAIDALNDAEAEYYDLSGKRLDEPQRGVNIVRMKSGKTKKIIIK